MQLLDAVNKRVATPHAVGLPMPVVFIGVTGSVWLVHVTSIFNSPSLLPLFTPLSFCSLSFLFFLLFIFLFCCYVLVPLHSLSVELRKGIGAVGRHTLPLLFYV